MASCQASRDALSAPFKRSKVKHDKRTLECVLADPDVLRRAARVLIFQLLQGCRAARLPDFTAATSPTSTPAFRNNTFAASFAACAIRRSFIGRATVAQLAASVRTPSPSSPAALKSP